MSKARPRILYVINEAFFFMSHRLPVARAARDAGLEVHVATPTDHVWAPDDFRLEALAAEGFTHHPIPLSRRGTNPLQDFATLLSLVRLFRTLAPDIVHLMTIKPTLYGGLAARLTRMPAVVITVTGLGQAFVANGASGAMLRRAVVALYRLASGHPNVTITFQNPDDMETLERSGVVTPDRSVLIRGSGVSLNEFQPRPEPDEKPVKVLMPARMIWEKGVGEFVEAARLLKQAGVEARFLLVGNTRSSNPRAVPAELLRQWHDAGLVEWWGRREDMAEIYADCHIVCQPSKYGEGVPKVLIEAAASGRAIVASDIAGCRQVVRHGENGLLVPAGDAAALAAALRKLIEDSSIRHAFGAAGRRIAAEGFAVETVVEKTLEIYAALRACDDPASSAYSVS